MLGTHAGGVVSPPEPPPEPPDPPEPPEPPPVELVGVGVGEAVSTTVNPIWLDPVLVGVGVSVGTAAAETAPTVMPMTAAEMRATARYPRVLTTATPARPQTGSP